MQINNIKLKCLIDTGADISILSKSLFEKNIKIEKTDSNIRTANGTKMNII